MLSLPVPLFVYGSLKRGFRHHDLLKRALWLGEAIMPGCRLARLGEYPAVVPAAGGWVRGELYRVDWPLLAALDAFEDCPALYRRKLVATADGNSAFVYFAADEELGPPLPGTGWAE